ncbi:class F sortase [Pseudarthrobacter sp. NamE5]|uniref:class F sortase n=1 Tax=Pseudarthrobacter sp. NamE5 TaxID=2576839 RepID=UPI00110A8452|nr:class F sortase [Pseudarthrobacter sp. NamE5]TLM84214.1 class F sortase [Pseudarthrobacter sp. NamE5]
MAESLSRHAAEAEHPRRRWNRGDVAILLCGVLAFLSITFGAPLFHQPQSPAGRSAVESARTIEPADLAAPSAQPVLAKTDTALAAAATAGPPPGALPEPALPQAAAPLRIRYPSADFHVPVHPLELDNTARASQTIVPPATKDGYWLTAFGSPGDGSENTTYVIGHSWDGAEAPFNHLSSAAAVGERFEVDTAAGTIEYQVDSVTTYLKSSLKESPIWEMLPNRLVLISCYTEDPWGKNVVVTASPAVS